MLFFSLWLLFYCFIVAFVLQRYGLFFIGSKLNPLIITNIINNLFYFYSFLHRFVIKCHKKAAER